MIKKICVFKNKDHILRLLMLKKIVKIFGLEAELQCSV